MGHVLDVAYRHDQEPKRLRTREDVAAFVDELVTLGPAYAAATAYAVEEGSDALTRPRAARRSPHRPRRRAVQR